jgi:hypothetical protein
MVKKIMKLIIINVIVLSCFFGFMELVFRSFYPEFIGHIHAENITLGKKEAFSKFQGFKIRVPYEGFDNKIENSSPIMLFLGDSITCGYGCAFEDIYWEKFNRLINGISGEHFKTIALASFGNDADDSISNLEKLLTDNNKLNIKYVIYQFNYNDIIRVSRSDLHQTFRERKWFTEFARFRYKYLGHSVFLRVLQHYASVLTTKTSGSCYERKEAALGSYTWSYGAAPFKEESEKLWESFNNTMIKFKLLCDKIHATCIILISPLNYDIYPLELNEDYKYFKLDFSCATINPRERLTNIANKLNIDLIDPTDYLKNHFNNRLKEGNFEPFYFTADCNHITPVAADYIAEYMIQYFIKNKLIK